MTAFRDLVGSVREQWNTALAQAQEQAQAGRQAPMRPTSLYAAGSVGEPVAGSNRPRQPLAGDPETGIVHRNLYPERPVVNDQEPRAHRRPPVPALSRAPQTDSRAALLTALRSPASLRTAILVREVLEPPLALRDERAAHGQERESGTRTG